MPTCCFRFEHARSTAHSGRCSSNGFPAWRTTIQPTSLTPLQREYPTNRHALQLGLQVIGKPFDEETVFAVSAALEQAAGFSALPAIRAEG